VNFYEMMLASGVDCEIHCQLFGATGV